MGSDPLTVAIMQPTFNPWLGYFDLIESVDLFVFLDTVQLARRSWQTRNRMKISGNEHMISIPVQKEHSRDEMTLNSAKISGFNWAEKALKSIEMSYRKAAYFNSVFPVLKELLLNKQDILSYYNSLIIKEICAQIEIDTKFVNASELGVLSGSKDRLLFDICKRVGAERYLSPQGSLGYLSQSKAGEYFQKENIALYYHDYEHPVYPQVGGGFIPYMGVFDLLLNSGFDKARNVIFSGHKEEIFYKDIQL